MKPSVYNVFVPLSNVGGIVFNSLSRQYLQLSLKNWDRLVENNSNFSSSNLTSIEYEKLFERGFFVEDKMDEYAVAQYRKMATRLNKKTFHLIINPTLDCNLRCWYCYEKHKRKSIIDEELIENIYNHVLLKYFEDKYEQLQLSFFGGEPMLAGSKVTKIINKVSDFCKSNNIFFSVHFTTNGTMLPKIVLESIKNITTNFQITIDGSKEQHNKVRGSKSFDSYERIWQHIHTLNESLKDCYFSLRINYDSETFKDMKGIINDILGLHLNNEKVNISLKKVWQVDPLTIDYNNIFQFIEILLNHNFTVNFLDFSNDGGTTCYADKINSEVINYDGLVYKCTARDFSEKNDVGIMLEGGIIKYKYEKINKYVFVETPSQCKRCSLFPACSGFCSQSIIEGVSPDACALEAGFTKEDYVLFNYKLSQYKNK